MQCGEVTTPRRTGGRNCAGPRVRLSFLPPSSVLPRRSACCEWAGVAHLTVPYVPRSRFPSPFVPFPCPRTAERKGGAVPRLRPALLASVCNTVPRARGFLHEVKLDGYRLQAHVHDGRVKLYTRSGLDWTSRFPPIAADMMRLPARKAIILDGEVICTDANGLPNFGALQDHLKRGRHDRMVFYAFDLLHLDGHDTRPAPLIERKRVLQSLLTASVPRVLYSEHFEDGTALYAQAAKLGLEGVVSKRVDAPYRSGRGDHWHKTKCWQVGRFIVVGYAPDGMGGLAKLRLARREAGKLVYAGRVGTGWDYRTARDIRAALAPLARSTSPLAKPLRKNDTTWTEPRYEAEVAYADMTDDGMIRHPSFKALRHRR
jgi:bifunctional non-homologous end joining protein LigD